MKTEMEPNITLNTKRSFLPEHNRLKKFTIPKRTPDKDILMDCSTNQRDYHEIKERLNQGCLDREYDLGSLWHFDKIEIVHNKDLEEEFVAKRTKMREQGRMDRELSSFLVVSKEEVLKICQSGLRTSNSIKKELDIMRELGNPQLGVYLFRHVDIALNYAAKHSVPVENIIIFRVLLGKVKKIQPLKGKKKVALDPTPNYDCHVSRIPPSLKDSIEDQAIGSLVYFYEYSELSKPVDRPRQCLPHAVVKVHCINQKVRADYPVISLKCKPKRFFKGRGRGLLLENCTIVTRIGNSKLIYEHFHKPKNCAVNDNLSVEVSSLSESAPNWNCSEAETQGIKIKHKLPGRWDSAQVEADVQNFQCMPDLDCNRDVKSDHMGTCSKNPNDTSVNYGELSTTITSKSIKDPRLTKKGKNPGEQNGETISHGILQCEMEENASKKLGECIDDVKDWMDTSHILESENSASDFNLNFQDKCSLTESQLIKIESGKEKLSDLSDPALLTKCTGLTTEDTALMLLTSAREPLECMKDAEIKHPQFENTSHSTNENLGALNCSLLHNNSMPEIFEQELAVKCTDINTPDLEVNSETEILSGGYKKWVSIPLNLCSHTEVSSEEAEYQYLQERMDWENLLAKPSPDTEISRSTSLKENKNECSCEENTDVGEKATKIFNIYVRPNLQITVANTLYPHHSSLKMRMGMGKFVTKCSEQKKGITRSQEGKNEKYTLGQKNSSIYHQKKVLNTHCSSEMALPLSKGQFETFEQSENHIKNVLHSLNTEASLCKNTHLSRKINGAMFHLKKAQRSVRKYLNILAKTVKKKRNVSNSHKTALSNLLEGSDCASYKVMSVQKMAACFAEQNSSKISMLTSPIEMREAGEKTNCKLKSHIESKGDVTYSTTNFLNDNESHSRALCLDCSVTSALISDIPCSSDNMRVRVIEHELSEKSTSSDTMELGDTKPASSESGVNSEQKAYTNVVSENNIQEQSNNSKNITSDTRLPVEVEQTALGFIMQMSEILQKADETSCLNVLQEQVIVCKSILPLFIRAFEEKQDCSFEHVLVSRENAEKSMRAKLKPCAIESLVELQIIMETVEFLENKRRYLQGKRTFRSLLWFDDSLFIELFGGQSGYQQQSNFYPAFQRSLKYNALNELQSHHKKLVDKFEITRLENKSYYCLLKLRREIKECEAAVKSNSLLSEFFLSEPYICGANYGDTIEDLENARKSTVGLINTCRSLSSIPLGTEKMEHLEIIMDIISTKIEFIRSCKEGNIKSSFIGLEHIFFNAAVNCILRERSIFVNGDFKSGEGEMLKIYEAALPKLYEIYENRVEKLERNFNCASEEHILRKSLEKPCNYKKVDGGANYDIRNYLVSYPEICIGEILDEAQSVNLDKLRQHQCRCTEQLEVLKKYFQIIQEEDVDHVLITKENVLSFMESSGLRAIRLKPEAVEVYTELAMVHETLCFLQNSIARQEDKPRFRSLLWCDLSLVNELFHCQQKMASFSYRKDNLLEIIESAISDLQDELNVVYDYAESLNCSYARQLLTRELEELLETRKYLQMSVSSISMCVDLVPYTIALNYGSNISELEYNYEQFYLLLEKLLLADRKDLGKMAHVMKILKTIEHMKFICTKQQKPPLHLVICQMLKNWRKSHQVKKQGDMRRHMDTNGSNTMKHKRPAGIISEDNSCDHEDKNDSSDSKKKKIVASLMTTKKKQEKETCRNMRKGGRPKPLEREELQLRISTDNTWNKKDECQRDRPSLSPSYSKGLKAADPLDCIGFSPSVSSPVLVNSNTLDSQKNPADLKDLNKNWRGCSKENNQACFASCDERGKVISVSPNKIPSPQNFPEDSFPSGAKLSGDSSVLPPLDQYHDLKQDVTGNASGLIPSCCTAIPLELDSSGEMYGKKSMANYAPACNSDSSAIPELNKFMELESLCSDPFPTENTQTSVQCSAFGQNEHIVETPHIHSYSVHTYRTVYPSYSWHFYQTGSSCQQITQTYQEFSSYEMHQHTPTTLTATSMVYNTQSSTFYSQSYSHFGVGESQRFNFAQTYPAHSYFNSTVPFPYSCQQWPSWYTESHPIAQATYPYSSNIGL